MVFLVESVKNLTCNSCFGMNPYGNPLESHSDLGSGIWEVGSEIWDLSERGSGIWEVGIWDLRSGI